LILKEKPLCIKTAQTSKTLMDQGLWRNSSQLLTKLSTVSVRKARRRGGILGANYLRTKKFPNGIKDFSECQPHCTQSYPQKMCRNAARWKSAEQKSMPQVPDSRFSPHSAWMPCFCAKVNYAYESRTCHTVKVLAHNLIHKRCAEHRHGEQLHGTLFDQADLSPKSPAA
jgi:hypothetical protein